MVRVRKRPPTADGGEAGVAIFGEDHGVRREYPSKSACGRRPVSFSTTGVIDVTAALRAILGASLDSPCVSTVLDHRRRIHRLRGLCSISRDQGEPTWNLTGLSSAV